MFCATAARDALPERLWTPSWESTYTTTKFYAPFVLIYWDIIDIWAPKVSQLLETQAIDWVFIIGLCFFAILAYMLAYRSWLRTSIV